MKKEIRHLKATCKYCGCIIDLDKGNVCSECSAIHDTEEHIERYNELQDQMNQIKVETAEAELESIRIDNARKKQQLYNTQRNTTRRETHPMKKILITWVLIFTFVVFILVLGFFVSGDWKDVYESPYEPPYEPIIEVEPEIIEKPVEVGFNEPAELIQYSVICDKMEEYFYPWQKPQEGFYYVKLHLFVSNKTDEKIYVPDEMICQYEKDGYTMAARENTISSDHLSTKIYRNVIEKQTTTEGWVYFEVPIGADLTLIYDDYVTINIPAENVLMLEEN